MAEKLSSCGWNSMCGSPSSSGILGHQSTREEGTEAGSRVQMAVNMNGSSLQCYSSPLFQSRRERMGTAAGASPHLCLAACFYQTSGAGYPVIMGSRQRVSAGICVNGHIWDGSGYPGREGALLERESSILRRAQRGVWTWWTAALSSGYSNMCGLQTPSTY